MTARKSRAPSDEARMPHRRKTGRKTQTRKKGRGAGSKRSLVARKRAAQALELRLAGFTWQEIADEVKYRQASTAYNAVSDLLDRVACERVEEYRTLELARLDALQAGLWSDAIRGAVDKVQAVLKIMERRAKLLGLDPSKEEAPSFNFFQFSRSESAHEHQHLHVEIPDDPEAQERLADHCRALELVLDPRSAGQEAPALPG